MLRSENKLLGVCILFAAVLFLVLSGFTDVSTTVIIGAVLAVGVIVPQLLLQFTDYGTE